MPTGTSRNDDAADHDPLLMALFEVCDQAERDESPAEVAGILMINELDRLGRAERRRPALPGALLAFRSETTHEVTPVVSAR